MSRTELLALSAKGLLAWLALSAVGWYFGEAVGQCLLPGFSFIMNLIWPDFSSLLKLIPDNHDYSIQVNSIVLQPVHLGGKQWLTVGQDMTAATHLMHTLVPMIIELSILLVWPIKGWRERMVLLALGLVTSLLVLAVTAPFVLLGNLEIYLQEMAVEAKVHRPEPWILTWMIFCEMGGRWVLPIVAAFLCIRLQRHFLTKSDMPIQIAEPLKVQKHHSYSARKLR
jgi:hypothetical protein